MWLMHRIEFFLCKFLEFCILFLPVSVAKKFCIGLALLIKFFLSSRRKLVLSNLSKVFKEKNYKEILNISKNVWINTGLAVFEFIRSQKLTKKNIFRYVEFVNEEFLKEAINYKKGVLLLTCHIGNWEVMGMALSLTGYPLMVIARKLKNRLVNKEINRIREISGEKVVPEHSAIKESLKWLNKGGCIGILIDQHITEGGIVVDFLGRPAATSSIVAILAKKTGAKVLPLYSIRTSEGKIKVIFEKPFDVSVSSDISLETEKMNNIIGCWIKKYPGQWFWLHNRWKI